MLTKKDIFLRVLPFSPVLVFLSCVASQQDIMALNRQIQIINTHIYQLDKVREAQAELGVEIDSMKQELRRISGILEENQHTMANSLENKTIDREALIKRLTALVQRMAQVYAHLNLKGASEPQKQTSVQSPITPVVPPTSQPMAVEEVLDSTEQRLYEETLAIYREGRYDEAVLGFENLIRKHPQSNRADNAQFWIGECYLALGKYEQAIKAYHEVETKYPEGNKVPNALLKQAIAFIEVKDDIAAKIVLKKLIKNHPNSEERTIAEAKLNTLN